MVHDTAAWDSQNTDRWSNLTPAEEESLQVPSQTEVEASSSERVNANLIVYLGCMASVMLAWIGIASESLLLYSLAGLFLGCLATAFIMNNWQRMTNQDFVAFGCMVMIALYGFVALGLISTLI